MRERGFGDVELLRRGSQGGVFRQCGEEFELTKREFRHEYHFS
jgi:hypothetical protein